MIGKFNIDKDEFNVPVAFRDKMFNIKNMQRHRPSHGGYKRLSRNCILTMWPVSRKRGLGVYLITFEILVQGDSTQNAVLFDIRIKLLS